MIVLRSWAFITSFEHSKQIANSRSKIEQNIQSTNKIYFIEQEVQYLNKVE